MKKCYYCGKRATTKEHLPPKQMFKAFECDSITVPSCSEHNCSKSGEDQAIVSTFLMSFKNSLKMNQLINPKVKDAVLEALPSFEFTKNRVESRHLFQSIKNELSNIPEIGFIKSPIKIKNWINTLTAGLVYDALNYFDENIEWEKMDCWSPDYVPSTNKVTDLDKYHTLKLIKDFGLWFDKKNKWILGWSAYPIQYPKEIYHFYVSINVDEIIFKHCFYQSYTWFAELKSSNKLNEKILNKIYA